MNNQLSTTRLSAPPPAMSQKFTILVNRARNQLEWRGSHYCISATTAPDKEECRALDLRKQSLQASLEPSDKNRVAVIVSNMFLGYPSSRRADAREAMETAAVYVSQLCRYPEWAIAAACQSLMQHSGRADRASGFVPSVEELAAVCKKKISPYQNELSDIIKIRTAAVEAPIESDEDRKSILEKFNKLVEELRGGSILKTENE